MGALNRKERMKVVYEQKLYPFWSKYRYRFQMIYSRFCDLFISCVADGMQRKENSVIQSVLRTRCFSWPDILLTSRICSRSTVYLLMLSKRTTIFFYTALRDVRGEAITFICFFVFFFVPYSALLQVQLSTKILFHQNFTSLTMAHHEKKKMPVLDVILIAWIVNIDVSATTIRNCPLPF